MIGNQIAVLERKSAAVQKEGDYVRDGLLFCGKCRSPKQCRVRLGGGVRVMGCLCDCENRRYSADREQRRREEEMLRADSLRLTGISDKGLRNCRFEGAADAPVIRKCRQYMEAWEEAEKENLGLLLWGDTGGGKTYAAACIANALIDRGVPAMITSFPRILSASFSERAELLFKIGKFPLLVLDDLGAERETAAALEAVYAVVDERYKSRKPLIVTTNLPLRALREAKDMDHKRIYDRVLEMCTPVLVESAGYRKGEASRKLELAERILEGREEEK